MTLGRLPDRFALLRAATVLLLAALNASASAAPASVILQSPGGQNEIRLEASPQETSIKYSVSRGRVQVIEPSAVEPILADVGSLVAGARVVDVERDQVDETFNIPLGKTTTVANRCSRAVATIATRSNIRWEIEMRAYDDGVAFRYRIPAQNGLGEITLREEATEFRPAGSPQALFNTLDGFTTSHESLYEYKPVRAIPTGRLMDMPLLLTWPEGTAAAITEARMLKFAGMYLERPKPDDSRLRSRLSPLPSNKDVCVIGKAPLESPWRVVLLGDLAGELLESNLLLCLNDSSRGDFDWACPGKTTFHWWYGEFEDFYKQPGERKAYFEKHKEYIDFCAANNIAYHSVSGDGRSWYVQSDTDYGTPAPDADVCTPRPELELPKIIDYAKQRGVGIRLWVHWKPLSRQREKAFGLYESWGVKGLMVDFLDGDDQEMIEWTEQMLESAARHKLHIQIHGSSKYSGEQRTFPNLFNREGVLNLEYDKWSKLCTPQHAVNVAYTRALAGPVDFHLGGLEPYRERTLRRAIALLYLWARAVTSWHCTSFTRTRCQWLLMLPVRTKTKLASNLSEKFPRRGMRRVFSPVNPENMSCSDVARVPLGIWLGLLIGLRARSMCRSMRSVAANLSEHFSLMDRWMRLSQMPSTNGLSD